MLARVLKNPVRFILLVVALLLATTLWSSVVRVSQAGVQSFEEALGLSTDDLPVAVVPVGGRLPLSAIDRCLTALPATVELIAVRRELGVVSSTAGDVPLRLIGVARLNGQPESDSEAAISASTILIAHGAAERLQVQAGQSVSVRFGDNVFRGQVGLLSGQNSSAVALPDSAVVPLTVLSNVAPPAVVDGLYMQFHGQAVLTPRLVDDVRSFLSSCAGSSHSLRVETTTQKMERAESLLAAYRFNVLIMAAMTLLVCGILVCQSISLSLLAVSRELSILKTLGVGSALCMALVMAEGVVAATVAAALGVTVGYPLTLSFTQLFLGTANDIYSVTLLEPTLAEKLASAAAVFASILLLGIGSSALGGLGALRVAPYVGTKREFSFVRPWSRRRVLGAAMVGSTVVAGVALLLVAQPTLLAAYAFIAVLLMGVASVVPAALWTVGRLALWRAVPAAGRLAQGAVAHGGRRYVWGALGSSLALTLMVALSLMVESFRGTLERWAAVRLQGDLFVSSSLSGQAHEARIPESIVHRIVQVPVVAAVIRYYETSGSSGGIAVQLAATDVRAQMRRGAYVIVQGGVDTDRPMAHDAALITEGAARKLALKVGDAVTVDSSTFRVQAVLQEFGTEAPLIVIDQSRFLELYPGHDSKTLTIDLRTRDQLRDVQHEIERQVGTGMVVRDHQTLLSLVRSLFNRTFRVTESVTWIVFVIAVLGLSTSTLQYVWERRREVKTLLVMGARPSLIVYAIVLESALVSAGVLAIGTLGGIAMGWCLTCYINPLSFGWTLSYSLSLHALVLSLVFVVAVIAAVFVCTTLLLPAIRQGTALSNE